MQFTTLSLATALIGAAAALYTNATVTTDKIVTNYVTYCPEATEVVVKTCHEEVCAPTTITVTAETTLTVSGEVEVPETTTSTLDYTITSTLTCDWCNAATSVAPSNITTFEGAAARNAAGLLAGAAAVAAALV
ncbi:uncharacterized protein PRCAT00005117001 [Priceomyces carsonii]|uniref:uncharacterized protein n=1 Tax=Priceomyces carsonii TaxID=28549 RepID=UPI002ED9AFE0|nr:unnamed protein product [Priceomyces carsonii]